MIHSAAQATSTKGSQHASPKEGVTGPETAIGQSSVPQGVTRPDEKTVGVICIVEARPGKVWTVVHHLAFLLALNLTAHPINLSNDILRGEERAKFPKSKQPTVFCNFT